MMELEVLAGMKKLKMSSVANIEKAWADLKQCFNCTICCKRLGKPLEAQCGHVFCAGCVREVCSTNVKPTCPRCKLGISSESLVARSDVADMIKIFNRANKVFNLDLQRFAQAKENASDKQLHTEQEECGAAMDIIEIPTDNNNEQETVIIDIQKKQAESDKAKKLERLESQEYIVVSASVVPESCSSTGVLDLSLSRKSRTAVRYAYRSAVKFVKPIDLSLKRNEKRKEDAFSAPKTSTPNKRSRLELMEEDVPETGVGGNRRIPMTLGDKKQNVCNGRDVDVINLLSSDDMFANLSDEGIVNPGSKACTSNTNKLDQGGKNLRNFAFKAPAVIAVPATKDADASRKIKIKPSHSISDYTSKAKLVPNIYSKKKDETPVINLDDEFQCPRDSDALFLALNYSGNQAKSPDENQYSRRETENIKIGKSIQPLKDSAFKLRRNKSQTKIENTMSQKHLNNDNTKMRQNTDPFGDDADWMNDEINLLESMAGTSAKNQTVSKEMTKASDKASAGQTKKYVFCPTRLNKGQMQKLKELCKMCNGTIAKEFTSEVTHLIIDLVNGRVPHTLKYLLAIAHRKWVVIYDWVENCVDGGVVISENDYETSNFRKCDPGVRRSRLSSTLLFQDFKFYFATDKFKIMGYSLDEVLKLMAALGSEIVSTPDLAKGDLVIIGDAAEKTRDYYNWLVSKQWITVTFAWVLECILEYRLVPFSSNHLCIDMSDSDLEAANVPKPLQMCISQYITQKSQMP